MEYTTINLRNLSALLDYEQISPDTFLHRCEVVSPRRWAMIRTNSFATYEEIEDIAQTLNASQRVILDPSEVSLQLHKLYRQFTSTQEEPDLVFREFLMRRAYDARITEGIPPNIEDIRQFHRIYRQENRPRTQQGYIDC